MLTPVSAVHSSLESFLSGERSVRLQVFRPALPGRHRTVLVLHGANGLDSGHRYVRGVAEAWAEQGFATLLLHYFDRTGTGYASEGLIRREFERWLETIGEAITFAERLPGCDAGRLGVVGYSLGGYLALARAARDERIRAVVEIAGGLEAGSAAGWKRLPPTLIVHGEEDRRVLFARAGEVQAVLGRLGARYETRFYPGEGHLLSPGAALDALGAGAEFLERELG